MFRFLLRQRRYQWATNAAAIYQFPRLNVSAYVWIRVKATFPNVVFLPVHAAVFRFLDVHVAVCLARARVHPYSLCHAIRQKPLTGKVICCLIRLVAGNHRRPTLRSAELMMESLGQRRKVVTVFNGVQDNSFDSMPP